MSRFCQITCLTHGRIGRLKCQWWTYFTVGLRWLRDHFHGRVYRGNCLAAPWNSIETIWMNIDRTSNLSRIRRCCQREEFLNMASLYRGGNEGTELYSPSPIGSEVWWSLRTCLGLRFAGSLATITTVIWRHLFLRKLSAWTRIS